MLLDQGNLLCFTTTRRNCSRIYEMAAFAMLPSFPSSAIPESSCGYLLQELKLIWDEVGQDQLERERILLELEQECIDMYRRKVDSANISRVRLHQALADSEAEFTNLLLSLGERSFPGRPEKLTGTLKQQLDAITPALHEMQLRKEERMNQFREVQTQIQRIASEIAGHQPDCNVLVNEGDLSLKKLDEHQNELQRLHKEKNARLRKVEDHIKVVQNLAETMAMDASTIIGDIHPSLLGGSTAQQSRNISDTILEGLKSKVEQLKDEKRKRTEKVESEVERLDQLKASKMKELFLKKLSELREICQKSHLEVPSGSEMDKIMNLIMSGEMDHADLLVIMEEHISQAKEEACSRKDIMEKVEKWMASCEEEQWLEEYSKDENRYSVSRGAHKNLKRAERARIIVNKIPAYTSMQDQDIAQVPLMAMLKEYTLLKQEKEEEKQRQRERKKVQTQITAEHENSFGSRPNTSTTRRSNNILNSSFVSAPSSRRLSIISQHQRSKDNYANKGSIKLQTRQMLSNCSHAPNSKEDAASEISITFSG
ncbi:Microtubule associated protein (MAP65/ASE1 family) [Musa troglodytarum]|uniref:Microtubule associated protein (MAP65/ASE1 family) n=1 Tax=Musa troglodytarum TaxID=320322 RepID=A0A9E7EUQ8_9LILI|nr:Microtubule associated protein (MAP65/ASE1 family) [Musa troglodytarum]